MASQTTNMGLVKPAYSESADVSILNTNMDTIDAAFGSNFSSKSVRQELDDQSNVDTNLEGSMAILANGNTHAAVASGQYVYVRNHGTLTEGLYKATAAIAANGGLTTGNLTAASSGGLNDLKGQIDSLNSKISNVVSISDNSDLNNYLTPGKYRCTTNSGARTIVNSPTSNAFYLDVDKLQNAETGAWLNILQRLTTYNGAENYMRQCSTDGSGVWSFEAWVKYTPTTVISFTSSALSTAAKSSTSVDISSVLPRGYRAIGARVAETSVTAEKYQIMVCPVAAQFIQIYNYGNTALTGTVTLSILIYHE